MMRWPWFFMWLCFSFASFAAEKLEFFYSRDCVRCEHANAALVTYQAKYPEVEIIGVNVSENQENLARLRYIGVKEGLKTMSLPAIYYHSRMEAGFKDPALMLAWLEEVKSSSSDIGHSNFLGMTISYEKVGASLFSAILGIKDFFFSLWGCVLVISSVGLILSGKRFDSIIGMLCFTIGAVLSSVLWSLPVTRIWFEQVLMLDVVIASLSLMFSLGMILKTKKYTLSGWMELGIFSAGLLMQRLMSIFSGFELLRLQDVLLESGLSHATQTGMNIIYGLVQFMIAALLILVLNKFVGKSGQKG